MKLLIDKIKYIKFSRLKFYKNFLDYTCVNRVLNLKLRVTLAAKLKYNNYFILDDILDYNFFSNNRIVFYRAHVISSDVILNL